MATAEERKEFDRHVGGKQIHPVPKPPDFPTEIFTKPVPERKADVEAYNKKMDDWRKKIDFRIEPEEPTVPATATTTTTTAVKGPKGDKGDKGAKGDKGDSGVGVPHTHAITDVNGLYAALLEKATVIALAAEAVTRAAADTALDDALKMEEVLRWSNF